MVELRVGLIDSNELVRAGRAMVINSQANFKVVFEESDPNLAIERVSDYLVDVLVVAGVQHGYSGFSFITKLVEALKQSRNPAQVLVSGSFSSVRLRAEAIFAGAADFIGLDQPAKDFLGVLRAVGRPDFLISHDFRLGLEGELGKTTQISKFEVKNDEFSELEKSIIHNFLSGASDFENARRLDIAKVRVARFIDELISSAGVLTRNQLALALSEASL